jgi:hypothetical protein
MKHLQFGAKSLFVNDEAADALVDYAAHVAQLRLGDRVDLRGFSAEGNRIMTTFLLNAGTNLVAESTNLPFDEVDNDEAVSYMQGRIRELEVSPDFLAGFRVLDEEQV